MNIVKTISGMNVEVISTELTFRKYENEKGTIRGEALPVILCKDIDNPGKGFYAMLFPGELIGKNICGISAFNNPEEQELALKYVKEHA